MTFPRSPLVTEPDPLAPSSKDRTRVGWGARPRHVEFHSAGSQSRTDFHAMWQFMPPKAEPGFTQHNQGAGGLGPVPISALAHCFCGCCWLPTHLPSALTIF